MLGEHFVCFHFLFSQSLNSRCMHYFVWHIHLLIELIGFDTVHIHTTRYRQLQPTSTESSVNHHVLFAPSKVLFRCSPATAATITIRTSSQFDCNRSIACGFYIVTQCLCARVWVCVLLATNCLKFEQIKWTRTNERTNAQTARYIYYYTLHIFSEASL